MLKKTSYFFIYSFFIKLSSFIKISFILGSYSMFFSFSNISIPAAGLICGAKFSLLFFLMRSLFSIALLKTFTIINILYHIPTLFASIYLSKPNFWIGIAIPLICMLLFIIHPIGNNAYIYAFYWLIPLIIHLFNKSNLFLKSLTASFIAHAIGSVIWLYFLNLSAESWLALIPIVIIERILFACGIVIFYRVVNLIRLKFAAPFFLNRKVI